MTFITKENAVYLPDGTEVYRYDPKTKKHTVADWVRLYQKGAQVCELDLSDVDPEARLLVWIMAADQVSGEENSKGSSELWNQVPVYFPPRMNTLSTGYDGLHGPFGRGLDKIRNNPPPWFKFKRLPAGKMLHWLEIPEECVLLHEEVTLRAPAPPPVTVSPRAQIVSYLRELADRFERDDKYVGVRMPFCQEHRPLRPWYVIGEVAPQGLEYAGDQTIELKIVIPRRVGERVPRSDDAEANT